MNWTEEAVGKTVEEATAAALLAMKATMQEVDVEVLQEPKPAILGFGGREARVRITRRPSHGTIASEVASKTLSLMGYSATAEVVSEGSDTAEVVLSGQDATAIVGRFGRTLDALEFLVSMHVTKRRGGRTAITLDADGYRAKREAALTAAAREAGERAIKEGRPVAMEPMEAKERRIVHLALHDDPRVTTASEGEEGARFVIVSPRAENA
jgi:spoIIIJ-associated protein